MGIQEIEKVSKVLLKELELEALAEKVVNTIAEFTAVDKCILYQQANGSWQEISSFYLEYEGIHYDPADLDDLPETVLNTVVDSQKGLLFDAYANIMFHSNDPYIVKEKPFLVYCLPLLEKEKVLIYLENNIRGKAPVPKLKKKVKAFSANASIALGNALKYNLLKDSHNGEIVINTSASDIEGTYEDVKLLGQIGQDINANISVEKIIEAVYENVNTMMDASVFDIGIHNKEKNRIEFPGSIEKGEKLEFNFVELKDNHRLTVVCFSQNKEIFINDYQKEYNIFIQDVEVPSPVTGETPESLIYLPISDKEEVIGVITVQSFEKNAYTDYHLHILRNLAVYVAIALENAFLIEDIEKKKEEHDNAVLDHEKEMEQAYENVKLLGEIGQDITANLSVDEIVQTVYSNVNSLIDASMLSIGTYNEQKNTLDIHASVEDEKVIPFHSYSLDDEAYLAVFCFKQMREIFINDYEQDYKKYLLEANKPEPIDGILSKSIIYLPLIGKNGTIGILSVQSNEKNAYKSYHLNIVRNIAIYASIAIDNAILYQNLEDRVKERTVEVVMQKEEIEGQHKQLEKAFDDIELLSEIGQQLTAILSVDKIIESVYENVNSLMDAAAFGIGILNEEDGCIEFKGAIENGEPLPTFYHKTDELNRFSVWCIINNKEIVINDYAKDYKKYIPAMKPPEEGEDPESLIYMPLIINEKVIGVITVQSFEKFAFEEHHVNMLKNIAVYAEIALENADAYAQIERQNEEIRKASQKLTSSINYAQRIQEALLPHEEDIRQSLPDFFVLFKPKDIVSGDFFWFAEKDNLLILAAVDCTGHGVPGAFMSMIGNQYLKEIVDYVGLVEPDQILNLLHKRIRKALKQESTQNRDGMDMALCVIDRENKTLKFAGAERPIIHVSNGELDLIKGDRKPIGGQQREDERIFTPHTIPISDDSVYYIFSDGYQDQFGQETRKKFMLRNLKQLMLDHYQKPLEEQKEILEDSFLNWKKESVQIDDVLVIGFKI